MDVLAYGGESPVVSACARLDALFQGVSISSLGLTRGDNSHIQPSGRKAEGSRARL
jgi:hypothetical protein